MIGKTMKNFNDYLTVSHAAQLLGVTSTTLRNWDIAGKLKAHRHPINGYRLYLKTDLKKVLIKVE
ncbi:MAG: MerR family DNA-binding transcriptional regulator [Candidatus Omnitrophica bacterium]|nr:MerR family DNA-binding transcriptional regulator [Candidatus Omnitrophota bacterium]